MKEALNMTGDHNLMEDNLSMYQVPGYSEITAHTLERYRRDKEQNLEEYIDDSPQNFSAKVKKVYGEEKVNLIEQGINDQNPIIRQIAGSLIIYVSEEDALKLRKIVEQRVRQDLESQDYETFYTAIRGIAFTCDKDRPLLREMAERKIIERLEGSTLEEQRRLAEVIHFMSEEIRLKLRRLIFEKIIETLDKDDLTDLFLVGEMLIFLILSDGNIIREKIFRIILANLGGNDPEKQKQAMGLVKYVLSEKIPAVITAGLEHQNVEVQIQAAAMIEFAPLNQMTNLIKRGMNNSNIKVQKNALGAIYRAPLDDRRNLIEDGLNNPNPELQKFSAEMIDFAPQEEKFKLFQIALERGFLTELVKHPLYRKKEIDHDSFTRQDFSKTGSKTTLLGGKLMDKVVIRHLSLSAFLAWQNLYENFPLWRQNGFDYVPVEPIISYKLDSSGLVSVYTGVLDLSLNSWLSKTNLFSKELKEQRNKIINTLLHFDFKHGHEHDGNFCLRFYRDEEGQIDIKKVPRLYLIDFDQASNSN